MSSIIWLVAILLGVGFSILFSAFRDYFGYLLDIEDDPPLLFDEWE